MGFAGEDGRDVTKKGFVVEGLTPADPVRVAAEPGSENRVDFAGGAFVHKPAMKRSQLHIGRHEIELRQLPSR